jgi:hypothetical protein
MENQTQFNAPMDEAYLRAMRLTLDSLFKTVDELPRTRQTSLAYTAAELSKMWCGKALSAMGAAYPYPESKDVSTGERIAPVADEGSAIEKDPSWGLIERIKFLRNHIDLLVPQLNWVKNYPGGYTQWQQDEKIILALRKAQDYLQETGMWLGMELGRIRDERESSRS